MSKKYNDCNWLAHKDTAKEKCNILTELVCKKKGICSFRETKAQYEKRQTDFRDRHGITEG